MASESKIEWCDSTFNPWIGCTKISPACDHCYAANMMDTRRHVVQWGAGNARKRTSVANWNQPLRWNAKTLAQCGACGWRGEWATVGSLLCCPECGAGERAIKRVRRRVFCASLADWLDNEVPIEWVGDLLDLIRRTPHLDWLLLTKRIGNLRARLIEVVSRVTGWPENPRENLKQWVQDWLNDHPPANVWIGATICNQTEADRDVPKLLRVPAWVRFLSVEPMLGRIYLERERNGPDLHWMIPSGINWVICGGESGPGARPMHPDWVRSLRDQCAAAEVPFLFKQWGEWAPRAMLRADQAAGAKCQRIEGGNPNDGWVYKVGKKAAGRLLDGVEHNGFPRP